MLTTTETNEVTGGVTAGQVLNVGAGITAVGGAVLAGAAAIAGAPLLTGAVVAYGIVSATMWTAGALSDIGYFSDGGGGGGGASTIKKGTKVVFL
ncbi:hypothetical protein ACFDR9_005621 [Janthinobacterium sp. CG_23.3]|uniref:hypothetical protein n=1 Tax=Janthinobacterium sp. CG_23.3 TaxID=3349634 RepID=UPI0038D4A8EF